MTSRRRAQISTRKEPQQARSTELVVAILQAAVNVLRGEGAHRFTTARVAEEAGVSIGSVYQYFPNQGAILFRLQADEWRDTTGMLRAIVGQTARAPLERLRALIHAFLQSECEEAAVRIALKDAAPLYRDAPEARDIRREGDRILDDLMAELLPARDGATRALAGDVLTTTFSSVGSSYSETPRTQAEIETYAHAVADMCCAYVRSLQKQ